MAVRAAIDSIDEAAKPQGPLVVELVLLRDELAQVDEINMGFWNGFLKRLDSIEQADGKSLLDHTVLAYSSSAGMDHSRDKLPTVIFGGEALGMKHHTHLRMPEKTPLARVW